MNLAIMPMATHFKGVRLQNNAWQISHMLQFGVMNPPEGVNGDE